MERFRTFGLSRAEQVFLWLLRAGLWQTEVEDVTLFPLSVEEWEEVYQCSLQQTVQGIVFEGLSSLPDHLLPPPDIRWKWMAAVGAIEESYQQATAAATESHALLTSAGADIILQKGLAVARFYDKPERRVNGDIDWYVHRPALRDLMSQITHKVSTLFHADGSYSFFIRETEIELHSQLTDLMSSRAKRIVDELLQQEGTEQAILADGTKITMPGPIGILLLLTAHIRKHLCTVGIGLRQFCDLARAYHALQGSYDTACLQDIYQRVGIGHWSRLLNCFLSEVLGVPTEILPSCSANGKVKDKEVTRLLRDIMRGGNFGQHSQRWQSQAQEGHGTTWHTLHQIVCRLPFTFRYAPREFMPLTYNLIKNKLKSISL